MNPALRILVRSPRYSASVIVTLALALAGVDALVGVAAPVLVDPLPFPDSGSLFEVRVQAPDETVPGPTSHPGFLRLRQATAAVALVGAYRPSSMTLTGPDGAEPVPGAVVTQGLAETLGVTFIAGRSFTALEDAPGGPAVAVVGYDFWRSHMGSDPHAVGRTIDIAGSSHTVVGILAPAMTLPAGTDIWTPLQNDDVRRGDAFRFLSVVARLRSGADQADLAAALRRIPAADGAASARPLVDALFGDLRGRVLALGAGILGALLVACVNLGLLALVRALSRRGDQVVRLALGASTARLAGGVAMESVLLALVASALGWLLALAAVRGGAALAPPELLALGTPRVSLGVLVAGAALGLATALVASTLPVLALPRAALGGQLRLLGSGRRSARTFSVLMAGQAAVSLVLCTSSLALSTSLARQSRVTLGFDSGKLSEFRLTLGGPRYRAKEARVGFVDDLQARLTALPGVTSVGVALGTPLSTSRMRTRATVDGGARSAGEVVLQPASAGLVPTMGRVVLDGRNIAPTDDRSGEAVALVNQTLATSLWPGESALGRRLRLEVEPGGLEGERTVVGVISDVGSDLSGTVTPEVLVPYAQAETPGVTVVFRTLREGVVSARQIRDVVASVDPSLPVASLGSVAAHRARVLRPLRLQTALLVAFAVLTLVLVLMSVYAVTASLVARRRRELGVRMAVGCSPGALRLEVLGWGLVPVGVGLALGAAASPWAAGVMGAAVNASLPLSIAGVLLCAAAVAGFVVLALLQPVRAAQRMRITSVLGS